MRKLIVLFVCFLMGGATAAFADSESDGRAAEQAGHYREALELYAKALESAAPGSTQEQQLRERIIDVVKNVRPAPAVPQEALLRLGRARGFIELAKQPQDYQRPADELRAGLRIAPWWAEGYFNLAVVLEKAEKYGDAIASLKLYARAVDAKEAQSAAVEIARLEAKAEVATKTAAVPSAPQKPTLSALAGQWRVFQSLENMPARASRSGRWDATPFGTAQVRITGESFRATLFWSNGNRTEIDGQLNGGRLTGSATMFDRPDGTPAPCGQSYRTPFEAALNFSEPHVLLTLLGAHMTSYNPVRCEFRSDWFPKFLLRR